jgi:hypothetical protein
LPPGEIGFADKIGGASVAQPEVEPGDIAIVDRLSVERPDLDVALVGET